MLPGRPRLNWVQGNAIGSKGEWRNIDHTAHLVQNGLENLEQSK